MVKTNANNLNQNSEYEIEYKNLHLFYENLYRRLFDLINTIIDEKYYNINLIKNKVIAFTDDYSYYIIGKEILTKDSIKNTEIKDEIVLAKLENHSKFTSKLDVYPTVEYIKYRKELKQNNYKIDSIGNTKYNHIISEYYTFFDEVLLVLKNFIGIASSNGFLPIMKSKKSVRNIGFANYDAFFKELENLRIKMSEITQDVNFTNLFKCRRAIYSVMIVFSSYFRRHSVKDNLLDNLDFNFLKEKENTELMINIYQYNSYDDMGFEKKQKINDIIVPLKNNISMIKRYISYEFGELDMSPKMKNKYNFDPTHT